MPPEVSIVLATHNRAPLLRRTLSSLAQLRVPAGSSIELIVVANACTDDTLDVVREAIGGFPYAVRTVAEAGPGVACARNRGLAEARSDLIAFLDDDLRVERDWLHALLTAARLPDAGILVGCVTLEWEASRPSWTSPIVESLWGSNDFGWDARELPTASALRGANFAARRIVVDTIGGFQPALGRQGKALLSGEETEFGARALDAGFRLHFVPQMKVHHWIPRERATRGYLKQVAIGRGRSRIALQQSGYGRSASACIRLGTAQAALGATRAVRHWLRRDDAGQFAGTLLYHRGMATLAALVQAQLRRRALAGQ